MLKAALREILGLFVDDELLAVGTLVVVALTAAIARLTTLSTSVAAVVLLGGCLLVLILGVLRTARARRG
jgi:hypothetical protein